MTYPTGKRVRVAALSSSVGRAIARSVGGTGDLGGVERQVEPGYTGIEAIVAPTLDPVDPSLSPAAFERPAAALPGARGWSAAAFAARSASGLG